jgi:hypothetical protein
MKEKRFNNSDTGREKKSSCRKEESRRRSKEDSG